jgi:23S rRNA (uracil1939-C5)-methyltransferase
MSLSSVLRVFISDLGTKGEGIGKTDGGLVVFVPGALPGETVDVEIVQQNKRFSRALLKTVITASPYRVTPPCPVFGHCGGCQFQHLRYDAQLTLKKRLVEQALLRIGKLSAVVSDVIPSSSEWLYRNKAQFPLAKSPQKKVLMGFYKTGSHEIVDIDTCPIQISKINDVYTQIKALLKRYPVSIYDETTQKGLLRHVVLRYSHMLDAVAVIFVVNGATFTAPDAFWEALKAMPEVITVAVNTNNQPGNAILGDHTTLLWGEECWKETFLDQNFSLALDSFLQVNTHQAEILFQTVSELVSLSKHEVVWDLYCGIGALTLLLAKQSKQVLGVERSQESVKWAIQNAQNLDIKNAQFLAADLDSANLISGLADSDKPSCVILDPPRKGCSHHILQTLLTLAPKTLVYVSCDPATLARDLQILCGKYEIKRVQPIDLFPQTAHVETVVLLHLK